MSIKPIVSDVSIGNASVIIDCEFLKCSRAFNFHASMDEVPIICNWADGKVQSLRGNPSGEITVELMNLSAETLKWALDAEVTTKAANASVSCVKVEGIEWTPDDPATPTEWTAIVHLNSPNVDNVDVFEDSACTTPWDSATTPLNVVLVSECDGIITLTTDDEDEALDTLYFSFDYDVDYEVGTKVVKPSYSTFPTDHTVIAFHKNATTGNYLVYTFPRCQIIPDTTQNFDNGAGIVITTVKLAVVADTDFHPDCPLGWVNETPTLPEFIADLL